MNRDQRDSYSDVDDFWNIEHLIPEKKQKAPPSFSRPASRVEATEIEFSSKDKENEKLGIIISLIPTVKLMMREINLRNNPSSLFLSSCPLSFPL